MITRSILLKFSAFALPSALILCLAIRGFVEPTISAHKVAAAGALFGAACLLARFQWRRSFDLEAAIFYARIRPTDEEETKLIADVISLLIGALMIVTVFWMR